MLNAANCTRPTTINTAQHIIPHTHTTTNTTTNTTTTQYSSQTLTKAFGQHLSNGNKFMIYYATLCFMPWKLTNQNKIELLHPALYAFIELCLNCIKCFILLCFFFKFYLLSFFPPCFLKIVKCFLVTTIT